jgi:Cu(I)/Ag(I) efflux system membrane protein CusA/SilA
VLRVRPKSMTVATIIAGLLPIIFGSGTGSEVMCRIRAPVVGGMATAPLLRLVVIPSICLVWIRWELRLKAGAPLSERSAAQGHAAV